jgi:acyl-CoA thioesterase
VSSSHSQNPSRVPYHQLLDIVPEEVGGGRARVSLHVSTSHLRTLGIVHGGVLASLLDAAQGMAAASAARAGYDVVTVQLNINFLRPAGEGDHLIATGHVVHAGRRTAVTRGEVHTAEGELSATGSATLMFLPHTVGAAEGGIGPLPSK